MTCISLNLSGSEDPYGSMAVTAPITGPATYLCVLCATCPPEEEENVRGMDSGQQSTEVT